jgi:hypothetical protein
MLEDLHDVVGLERLDRVADPGGQAPELLDVGGGEDDVRDALPGRRRHFLLHVPDGE